ncbi:hypothetical protein [Nitrosopumilus piranensis]|uniref:hypothetical protein n=1 Tax=Nitrosopumilus piranensis TaxID=1582439 RepID=UPI000A848E41|nr:hypothetical protein [Nitrosopumilus piranensis]
MIIFSVFIVATIDNTTAQTPDDFSIQLKLIPSTVESGTTQQVVGYVGVIDKNGILAKPSDQVKINLESDNPLVASVPESITLSENTSYQKFQIDTGKTGIAKITAKLNDQMVSKDFRVGETVGNIPSDSKLHILLPTDQIHVNGEMPLSVFFTKDEIPLEVPKDIPISFEYENELLKLQQKKITIEKGTVYGINTITALEETGTAFIRASAQDKKFDVVNNVKVSSVNPSSIKTYVYPDRIAQETERNIEIFVTLRDSEGFPAIATENVPLDIISDNTALSIAIDEAMKNNRPMIKKGEFGYHLTPEYIFPNKPHNYTISVSSSDYGLDSQIFDIVIPLSADDPKAEDKILRLFIPPELPRGAKSIMAYQITAIEDDDDDPPGQRDLNDDEDEDDEEITVRTIDDLSELDEDDEQLGPDNLFPVQADTNYSIMKSALETSSDNLRVTSSNTKIVKIEDSGEIVDNYILPHSSYGKAVISTGQQTGEVTISTSLKGLAVGSTTVKVVNPVEPIDTKIFSPTGQTLVFDRTGKVELFVLPIDPRDRPTNSETGLKYILLPINEIVTVAPQKNFANITLLSKDLAKSNQTEITVTPIGVGSDSNLESTSSFDMISSSSKLNISMPFEKISADKQQIPLVISLTDSFGNPITLSENIEISVESSGNNIVETPNQVTLTAGESFVEALFTVVGNMGETEIIINSNVFESASTAIIVGEDDAFEKRLSIFVDYPLEPLMINLPSEITINIDDEDLNAVDSARVRLIPQEGSAVFPTSVRTDEDGKVSVLFTPGTSPKSTLTIQATKDGYLDDEDVAEFSTISDGSMEGEDLSLVFMLGVSIIIVVVVIIAIIIMRKKRQPEEEYEEYEEEI